MDFMFWFNVLGIILGLGWFMTDAFTYHNWSWRDAGAQYGLLVAAINALAVTVALVK